ncbi:ATP-dependent DNA helicase [Mycena chlorophos]|uniref:ATP-dependent DNA helicase n=1 Tax=Mycena chlorophos TaxID=658473 RepID=A0A8H6SVR5_MYCCL|nr:ATP-dependent DNA helicase [Mycena chlorophos]
MPDLDTNARGSSELVRQSGDRAGGLGYHTEGAIARSRQRAGILGFYSGLSGSQQVSLVKFAASAAVSDDQARCPAFPGGGGGGLVSLDQHPHPPAILSLKTILESHTVAEILSLLPANQSVPSPARRKRDRLIEFLESLPHEVQSIVRRAALAAPGTKRTSVKRSRTTNSVSPTTHFVHEEDTSIIDREHADYVPDHDAVMGSESDEDIGANEAEEREDIRAPLDYHETAHGEAEVDAEWEDYEPAVIPLQAHGIVDVSGETVPNHELFAHAAGNLLAPAKRDYLIRRGNTLVNEYPRTRNGQPDGERFAGDPGDANHMLGAFPVLFPYGCGGIEVDRQSPVSYADHVKWALEYGDRRFRRDFHFMFMAFSALQRRQICYSACLQIKRSTFLANEAAFLRLKPTDFHVAAQEEAQKKPISNPVIRALRQQLTTVRPRVMGTDESRIQIRSQVWGMSLQYNPPAIWATLNLSDTGDPVAQVLAGAEIDLDDFGAPTATMMRAALQSDDFRIKMQSFIRQNIRAHISGTTGADVLDIPVEKNLAYSRPEDPRLPDYPARAAAAERRIARAVQPHDCKPYTCQKLRKGRVVCKRKAPWTVAADDWGPSHWGMGPQTTIPIP